MAIKAQDVKKLREATGVGMMDCKKALVEADGDFDKAIEILRTKGQKVAAQRADRDASEGAIVTATTADGSVAVIAEVNSETDFVARNDQFVAFAQSIADALLAARPADLDAAKAEVQIDGQPLGDARVFRIFQIPVAFEERHCLFSREFQCFNVGQACHVEHW